MNEIESGFLEWSEKLTQWQRDLLRHLASGAELTKKVVRSYADAAEQAELKQDLPWCVRPKLDDELEFSSVDASHLSATVRNAEPVRIAKIQNLHGVNGLADGAALGVALQGITIIAGKNGSGKSGYTRILKQVAASRASEEVLPNAFEQKPKPTAVVSYQLGNALAQELAWTADSERTESPLQRVRVFDSGAARAQVAGSTEVAYVPPTLRVIADYTLALKLVEEEISADLQLLRIQERNWPSLELGPGSTLFENLGQELARAEIMNLVPLNPDEEEELAEIPATIRGLSASNPATLAIRARQRSGQLETLARDLERIAKKLSASSVKASEELIKGLNAAECNALEAQRLIEADSEIPEAGGEKWKSLWRAAMEFSQDDHVHEFTDLAVASARCPLCQQRLDGDARERFSRFAKFMSGEAQVALATARGLREAEVGALRDLPIESILSPELVDLVITYNEVVGKSLDPAIAEAVAIRDFLLLSASDGNELRPAELELTLARAIEGLKKAAGDETASAELLASADTSAAAAKQLEDRRQELEIRKELEKEKTAIAAQHDRFVYASRLEKSKRACSTVSASRKNSALSASYIEKVCDAFEEEAGKLGVGHVPVELTFDGSSRGVSYIKVILKGAPDAPVASVLSEGEQRVAAIAGFFADLTESGDQSALVFDDPVSSLDQTFRVRVARRLLEEAESRQVLVFTHDFSFVQYLYEEKTTRDKQALAGGGLPSKGIEYLHIERAAEGAGVLTTAEQWRHVGVKTRIARINERIEAAKAHYRKRDVGAYEAEARDIVGAIRETWEAFVELELLNGVVTRHDRRVQTQKLSKLVDLTDADIATVDLGMTVESRYMTGHAAPVSDGSAALTPGDLKIELDRFKDFRSSIFERRKG